VILIGGVGVVLVLGFVTYKMYKEDGKAKVKYEEKSIDYS
jgi:hypothetical protein